MIKLKPKSVRPKISVGLDLSCTGTGISVLQAAGDRPQFLYEECLEPKAKGWTRVDQIADQVMLVVNNYRPDAITIEGYGGSFKSSLIPLVEVGTVVRYRLRLAGYSWLEPAPTALKKFVLGKGVGDKDQILLHVFKRWGHSAKDGNTADAYGLACIGLGRAGALKGMTQPMLEVIGSLKVV